MFVVVNPQRKFLNVEGGWSYGQVNALLFNYYKDASEYVLKNGLFGKVAINQA